MDGVLVHEGRPMPGAPSSSPRCSELGSRFLVLTNNSIYTPRDLRPGCRQRASTCPRTSIWTSALATAQFLADQRPGGIGVRRSARPGLTTALHEVGYMLTERDPDYVVLGETRTYSFEAITRAIRLIDGGARFIATNPDATGPSAEGALPATGSVAALITQATGVEPYFVGKPNPLMMRSALNRHRRALGDHGDDRRPDGHRRRRRHRGRAADHPGADRVDPSRAGRPLPVPAHPGRRLDRRRRPAGGASSRRRPNPGEAVDGATELIGADHNIPPDLPDGSASRSRLA